MGRGLSFTRSHSACSGAPHPFPNGIICSAVRMALGIPSANTVAKELTARLSP